MSHYRHDMKLALIERARRAPVVLDLDPSEWEEVGRPTAGDKPADGRAMASIWIVATILLLAIVAAPAFEAVAHHAL